MTHETTHPEPLRFDLDSMLDHCVLIYPTGRWVYDCRLGRAIRRRELRRAAGPTQYRQWADSPRRRVVEALVLTR